MVCLIGCGWSVSNIEKSWALFILDLCSFCLLFWIYVVFVFCFGFM